MAYTTTPRSLISLPGGRIPATIVDNLRIREATVPSVMDPVKSMMID
jgi:hypothetical protein